MKPTHPRPHYSRPPTRNRDGSYHYEGDTGGTPAA